jgi:hypothetical protein
MEECENYWIVLASCILHLMFSLLLHIMVDYVALPTCLLGNLSSISGRGGLM